MKVGSNESTTCQAQAQIMTTNDCQVPQIHNIIVATIAIFEKKSLK